MPRASGASWLLKRACMGVEGDEGDVPSSAAWFIAQQRVVPPAQRFASCPQPCTRMLPPTVLSSNTTCNGAASTVVRGTSPRCVGRCHPASCCTARPPPAPCVARLAFGMSPASSCSLATVPSKLYELQGRVFISLLSGLCPDCGISGCN